MRYLEKSGQLPREEAKPSSWIGFVGGGTRSVKWDRMYRELPVSLCLDFKIQGWEKKLKWQRLGPSESYMTLRVRFYLWVEAVM